MNLVDQIKQKINEIRFFVLNDGGDIEFVSFKKGVVYIKMHGACKTCIFINETIEKGIKEILTKEIKEVKEIKLIN